jgi:hypothetical protein
VDAVIDFLIDDEGGFHGQFFHVLHLFLQGSKEGDEAVPSLLSVSLRVLPVHAQMRFDDQVDVVLDFAVLLDEFLDFTALFPISHQIDDIFEVVFVL